MTNQKYQIYFLEIYQYKLMVNLVFINLILKKSIKYIQENDYLCTEKTKNYCNLVQINP